MVHNGEVAAIFEEIADLLELENANPFRIRAYRTAARSLRDFPQEAATMVQAGEDLGTIHGVGEDLAAKIKEVVTTGTTKTLTKLRQKTPEDLTDLLKIPSLGPKRVKTLYTQLAIRSLESLRSAAEKGQLRTIPGFGQKIEAGVLEGIKLRTASLARHRRIDVAPYAEALTAYLRRLPKAKEVVVCGSYRRGAETVGDLDIVVAAPSQEKVMAEILRYPEITKITAHGPTKAAFALKSKVAVDLRLVPPGSFGAAIHYFTGSKNHVVAIRDLAQEKNLKVNEYGVFKGRKAVAGTTEESVYSSVGLPYIPPELRENRGEIKAAREKALPKDLVTGQDLEGDLHAHTQATDGRNSLAEMAEGAKRAGLSYLAITDHSRRMTMSHGLNEKRLRQQGREIDRVNRQLEGITLLKGIEVDILEDGQLDLPDDVLRELDVVIASIHSYFNLPRAKQTARLLNAMDHKAVTMIGHPSGRLIGRRQPYDCDMEEVIHGAKERGCFLELNANPQRLDLADIYCQLAKEVGVLVSINSDAHSPLDFQNLEQGITQARRGWLETKDVLNTRPLGELKKLCAQERG